MSLGGSLEDLSLLDILQIINVSRRTGMLRLDIPGRNPTFLNFASGNVADIVGGFAEDAFLGFFEAQGLVERAEFEEAKQRAGGDLRATLLRLIEVGILNRQLVEQARRIEIGRRLRELTQQTQGTFDFFLTETGDETPSDTEAPFAPLSKPVSPQNLLTQAAGDDSLGDWVAPQRHAPPAPPPPPKAPSEPIDVFEEEAREGRALPPEAAPLPQAPAARAQAPADVPPEAPAAPPQAAQAFRIRPTPSQVTILLASDESIFRNLLRRRLTEHFAGVICVHSLMEYMETCEGLLHGRTPFLGLVDLLMSTQSGDGYLGGLEVAQESLTRFPQVKVLLMTDLEDPAILDVARKQGVTNILSKPPLARLKVDEFEASIAEFAKSLCAEVDRILPPVEEEVATFLQDLGTEAPAPGDRIRDQLSLLKGLMGELASPKESSEISLLVLRLAAEYFERAILFLVKKDAFVGLGGFGDTGDTDLMMAKVRRLQIAADAVPFLDDAVKGRATVLKSKAEFDSAERQLFSALGPHPPPEVAVIPMISRGRVIALLYGDNTISGQAFPDLTGMEIFMAQAGLAMEKALLEMQLLHLKRSIPKELGDR